MITSEAGDTGKKEKENYMIMRYAKETLSQFNHKKSKKIYKTKKKNTIMSQKFSPATAELWILLAAQIGLTVFYK